VVAVSFRELPDNFFQQYSGQSSFSTGISNMPRAAGGPVSSGQPYLVGEQGPELFVPSASGTIIPNGGGGGAVGGQTVNVYVTQPLGTASQIADAVGKAIMQNLRGQGMRMPSGG
jgi:phage-related minor tail protein